MLLSSGRRLSGDNGEGGKSSLSRSSVRYKFSIAILKSDNYLKSFQIEVERQCAFQRNSCSVPLREDLVSKLQTFGNSGFFYCDTALVLSNSAFYNTLKINGSHWIFKVVKVVGPVPLSNSRMLLSPLKTITSRTNKPTESPNPPSLPLALGNPSSMLPHGFVCSVCHKRGCFWYVVNFVCLSISIVVSMINQGVIYVPPLSLSWLNNFPGCGFPTVHFTHPCMGLWMTWWP